MKNKNVILLAMMGGTLIPLHAQKQQKMNVLFIMADDMNNNLGCYGHYIAQTPNLDRLAKQGLLFSHSYCQLPLSGPSRASLLTGMRASTLNVLVNETEFRSTYPDAVTLPQLFMKNGYFVGRVGKLYHYGVPGEIGTDGHDDTLSWQKRVNPKGRDKSDENMVINYTPDKGLGVAAAFLAAEGSDLEQTDGIIATETIKMLSENKDKSFFIAAGFFRPHCPYIAPKKYFDLYPLDLIRVAENPEDDLKDIPALALNNGSRTHALSVQQQKEIRRAYYASISFVDAQVGRLLHALDSLGLSSNTIVVFLSDHGYSLGEHFLWQKMHLFEEASRMPMMMYNPAIKTKNHISGQLVEMLDIYPTIADMCGLTPPSNIEGMSMKCLFEGNEKNWKKGAITEVSRPSDGKEYDKSKPNAGYAMRGRSVRTEHWRYTEWDGGKAGVELYDHQSDPGELINLAGKLEYADVIKELKKMLK